MHKILIVDDEVQILRLMELFFTKNGFQVISASSGEKGIELIVNKKPDLLIVDNRMPGIGGKGLLKELKKKKITTPAIVLTGSLDTPECMSDFKALGYQDFLFKPVDLNELLELVNKKLEI